MHRSIMRTATVRELPTGLSGQAARKKQNSGGRVGSGGQDEITIVLIAAARAEQKSAESLAVVHT